MKLEEYIAKRKKEDGINEFDLQKTADNTEFVLIIFLNTSTIILNPEEQIMKLSYIWIN